MYKYAGYTKDLLISLLYRAAGYTGSLVGALPGFVVGSPGLSAAGSLIGGIGGYATAGGVDAAMHDRSVLRGALTGVSLPLVNIPTAIGGMAAGGLAGAGVGGAAGYLRGSSDLTSPMALGGLTGGTIGYVGGTYLGTPLLWGPLRRQLLQLEG